ncbi:glycosyltransferase family 4 protein [Phragmitibacter flavus]|uniref:Glycosyltransferase family 4 protein n=1 Tax=Phragmitibacter flavus TaxID=2576071 RepID=A0A5R8KIZ9_9BACT|nr:glycosyltransferase family 4 protein [Phragmitibacter flavus]TLD72306.1 glycosyltransferase family 4 protein [Phragmitibacter flavus]
MPKYHLAYVFERFPTFTQTFCVREVLELVRLGLRPIIFSIHDTRAESVQHFPKELFDQVHFLPPEDQLVKEVLKLKKQNRLPQSVVLTLRHWNDRSDKLRVYEAAWIGHRMRQLRARVHHAHSHFAGVGARTCWWLRKFHGLSYSFTAHANDIFCNPGDVHPKPETLARDASLIVTVSDYTARDLHHRFPAASARVRRVYNGLDLGPFQRAKEKQKASKNPQQAGGILSVGRLIEKKGYDDLIAACALMRDRGLNFHCRIVGEGPLEAELRFQIADLNLNHLVSLTGPLPMNEIIRLLAEETQIFALACKTEKDGGKDNLPTVLMEAMAAELPCVSTHVAGVPEMVINGETGLLCEERQPEALAGLLAGLLSDPARCEQMGKAGLAHARQHFSKEITAQALMKAFARHTSMRFDLGLALRRGLWSDFRQRQKGPHLYHVPSKASDKTFNLDQFMQGT